MGKTLRVGMTQVTDLSVHILKQMSAQLPAAGTAKEVSAQQQDRASDTWARFLRFLF